MLEWGFIIYLDALEREGKFLVSRDL